MFTPRTMVLPVLWVALVAAPVARLAAASGAPIAVSVAPLFIGEEKIVEGKVTAAERDGNVVRLRLGTAPQTLTVSLVIGLLSDFPPDPERHYLGQTVRVAGTIGSFRGTVEIVIHDPANIRIVGAASSGKRPPVAAQNAPAAEPAVLQRLDNLNDRLRALEKRVQQLEGSSRAH